MIKVFQRRKSVDFENSWEQLRQIAEEYLTEIELKNEELIEL